MNSLFAELYVIEGRIGRLTYFWKTVRLAIITTVFIFVAYLGAPLLREFIGPLYFNIFMTIYFLFLASIVIFPPIALQIRRLHDIGLSGWLVCVPTLICFFLAMFFGYQSGFDDAINMASKAASGLYLVFVLFLLLWPGEDGRNQYGLGAGLHHTQFEPNKRQALYSKASAQRTYEVTLREPMAEDSLYIFKHLRQEYRDIQKIVVPESRDTVNFVIIGSSALSEAKIKKMLHELGVFTKRVKKKSS